MATKLNVVSEKYNDKDILQVEEDLATSEGVKEIVEEKTNNKLVNIYYLTGVDNMSVVTPIYIFTLQDNLEGLSFSELSGWVDLGMVIIVKDDDGMLYDYIAFTTDQDWVYLYKDGEIVSSGTPSSDFEIVRYGN